MTFVTLSGRYIGPSYGLPTPEEIAFGLSRCFRFGGQTIIPYSVLDHSLVAFAVASRLEPEMAFFAAMHDWHECLTGDIPRPFKTPDMTALQNELDSRFFAEIGLNISGLMHDAMKRLDNDLLGVEAYMLNTAAFLCWNESHPLPDTETFLMIQDDIMAVLNIPTEEKMELFLHILEGVKATSLAAVEEVPVV